MKTTLLTSVAVFALTAGAYAPSANALSAGVFQQSGNNIRVLVSHRGEPTQVELFAVDAEYNRVDARVFPATFAVTDKARRVSVKAPTNTYAVCVRTLTPVYLESQVGVGFDLESCARVNTDMLQRTNVLNFGSTRQGQRIRHGLQNPSIQQIGSE